MFMTLGQRHGAKKGDVLLFGNLEDRYKVIKIPNATTMVVLEEVVWLNNRTFELMFLWSLLPVVLFYSYVGWWHLVG